MNPIKKFIYTHIIPLVGRLVSNKNKLINVIYYHDIVQGNGCSYQKTNIEVFKKHMEYIVSKGYKTLRFDDLDDVSIMYDPKSVLIVFDDGWQSNYTEIFEYMKSKRIKYNVYLAVKEIGHNPNFLTWKQIREMHGSGLVGFGTHTFNHVDTSNIENIDSMLEFKHANEVFKQELGYEPLDFCYPYGAFSEESNKFLISNTPYKRIYTSKMMYSHIQDGVMIFGRNGISNEDSMKVFTSKLKGFYNVWKNLLG